MRIVSLLLGAVLLAGCGSGASGLNLDSAARTAGGKLYAQPYELGIGDHAGGKLRYATNPPVNGTHAPRWAADGNYAGVEPPPVGEIVHALEHGRIVIWYRPGIAPARLAALERLYDEDPRHVLLVENRTKMGCEVAISAWAHGMQCPTWRGAATLDALRAFRDTYRDKGPETIP